LLWHRTRCTHFPPMKKNGNLTQEQIERVLTKSTIREERFMWVELFLRQISKNRHTQPQMIEAADFEKKTNQLNSAEHQALIEGINLLFTFEPK